MLKEHLVTGVKALVGDICAGILYVPIYLFFGFIGWTSVSAISESGTAGAGIIAIFILLLAGLCGLIVKGFVFNLLWGGFKK